MIPSGLVNLYTRDIDASVEFYRDVLGLRETFRTPTDGTPGAPATAVVFWTEDVDTTYARLIAAGAAAVTEPHDQGNDNRNAVVRDPDGNLVELVAKRT